MEARAMKRPVGMLFAMTVASMPGCLPGAPPPAETPPATPPHQVPAHLSSPVQPEALSSERDSFEYEADGVRDPFLPPRRQAPQGPRLHELTLLGVVLDPAARSGVALLRVGGPGAFRAFRVRSGDELGEVRVLAVRRDRVVVAVNGAAGQAEIVLPRPAGKGAS